MNGNPSGSAEPMLRGASARAAMALGHARRLHAGLDALPALAAWARIVAAVVTTLEAEVLAPLTTRLPAELVDVVALFAEPAADDACPTTLATALLALHRDLAAALAHLDAADAPGLGRVRGAVRWSIARVDGLGESLAVVALALGEEHHARAPRVPAEARPCVG